MRMKILITLLAIGLFVLVGCGSSSEKADSIEDIVGTWRRVRVGNDLVATDICQFSDNGTYICAMTLEEINKNEGFKGNFWFEDSQYFDQLTDGPFVECTEVGVYEIQLLENGNLKYVLVEDACDDRAKSAAGRGAEEGLIEWKRVP